MTGEESIGEGSLFECIEETGERATGGIGAKSTRTEAIRSLVESCFARSFDSWRISYFGADGGYVGPHLSCFAVNSCDSKQHRRLPFQRALAITIALLSRDLTPLPFFWKLLVQWHIFLLK